MQREHFRKQFGLEWSGLFQSRKACVPSSISIGVGCGGTERQKRVVQKKKSWMRRASIPLPIPCEGITLPFELHTHFCFFHSTTPFQTTTPRPPRRQDTHAITPNPLQNQKWKNLPRNQKHKKRIIMDLALNIAVWSGLALSCIACLVVFPLILGNEVVLELYGEANRLGVPQLLYCKEGDQLCRFFRYVVDY